MGLVRSIHHLLLLFLAELRKVVNVLPLVCTIGHTEREVKFELGEDLTAEEVFLDQGQVCQRLVIIYVGELQIKLQVPQLEECSWERMLKYSHIHGQTSIVLHGPCEVIHLFVFVSRDMEELRARVEITNAVLAKSDVLIVRKGAQNALRRLS